MEASFQNGHSLNSKVFIGTIITLLINKKPTVATSGLQVCQYIHKVWHVFSRQLLLYFKLGKKCCLRKPARRHAEQLEPLKQD